MDFTRRYKPLPITVADQHELLRPSADTQPSELVVVEDVDRFVRLSVAETRKLVSAYRAKGPS